MRSDEESDANADSDDDDAVDVDVDVDVHVEGDGKMSSLPSSSNGESDNGDKFVDDSEAKETTSSTHSSKRWHRRF